MTVRYRPICIHQAWRSQLSHSLTSVERFGELYLLTNPATNSIGCYSLVPRIAAAEVGMSTEELMNVLKRLEEMGVAIYRDGYILVRTWFFHSTWESTLSGNVLKTALTDIRRLSPALQAAWGEACQWAGVPKQVVQDVLSKALASPSEGTSKGLAPTQQQRPPETELDATPTTTTLVAPALALLPSAEAHRATLVALGVRHGLTPQQQQELGWELSARLDASARGTGKPIGLVPHWLESLIHKQLQGQDILQVGRRVRDAEHAKLRDAQIVQDTQEQAAKAQAASRAELEQANLILGALDEARLHALIEQVHDVAPSRRHALCWQKALRERKASPSAYGLGIKKLLEREGLLTPLPPAPPPEGSAAPPAGARPGLPDKATPQAQQRRSGTNSVNGFARSAYGAPIDPAGT